MLPWLSRYSQSLTARHLLYKGLRANNDDTIAQLIPETLAWLGHHGTTPDAGFVLGPLLGRDLDDTTARTATTHALAWLDHHGTTPDAQFVFGRLLALTLTDTNAEVVKTKAFAWIEENGVGSDMVSKFVVRLREITEGVAEQLLIWADEDPRQEDLAWRLVGVARKINDWPRLVPLLLSVIERAVPDPNDDSPLSNSHGEFDGLMDKLCTVHALRCGIGGARLDDILRRWIVRPEAFKSPSKGSHYRTLVSRVASLFVVSSTERGAREVTLDRLDVWIQQWDCSDDMRVEAQDCLHLHRELHQRQEYLAR